MIRILSVVGMSFRAMGLLGLVAVGLHARRPLEAVILHCLMDRGLVYANDFGNLSHVPMVVHQKAFKDVWRELPILSAH